MGTLTLDTLRAGIVDLAPWHLDVQVTPEVSTRLSLDVLGQAPEFDEDVEFHSPRDSFTALMDVAYPDGLEGLCVLDCACNCGAYLFWSKELGAGECLGFDVREHWIRQAHFLREHRTVGPTDCMRFETWDLYDLPDKDLEPFDVTVFNGIFYHLPDPVTGLKIAADLTADLMIVNTSTYAEAPDGFLAISGESANLPLSGVYGLNWRPTGPDVMGQILSWAGFRDTFLVWWVKDLETHGGHRYGRLLMVASKNQERLAGFWELASRPGWNPIREGLTEA